MPADQPGIAMSTQIGDVEVTTLESVPHARKLKVPKHDVPTAPEAPVAEPAKSAVDRELLKKIAMALTPILIVVIFLYAFNWYTVGRYIETTDDAYVGADNTTLAAKVSGYVSVVEATDNLYVHSGDVIVRIDDGDYKLAEQTALDNIASQQAAIDRITKQIVALTAAVEQAKAQLLSAQAGATRASLELKRQKDLSTRDFASHQSLEQAQAANDQAVAAVMSARAALAAAEANVEVSKAQRQEAEGVLKQLQTALAKARRDLSFTIIRAPFDGVIGNRAVQNGDFVQPGQRLATLVPLDTIYIDANFKETQFAELRPGQPVEVMVDAVPGHVFEGNVVSLAPASGSVFSLLPADNATGNFTKVVQRLPVRIQVTLTSEEKGTLRPGMSVIVRVNTKGSDKISPLAAPATTVPANKP